MQTDVAEFERADMHLAQLATPPKLAPDAHDLFDGMLEIGHDNAIQTARVAHNDECIRDAESVRAQCDIVRDAARLHADFMIGSVRAHRHPFRRMLDEKCVDCRRCCAGVEQVRRAGNASAFAASLARLPHRSIEPLQRNTLTGAFYGGKCRNNVTGVTFIDPHQALPPAIMRALPTRQPPI
ncbi:hypothetical protein QZM21_02970 [Burkholderia orbicola]|nr:hypothetical protein [Burkholderia orbicola]MDN7466977.1 hypothetical protein [Burkholderia orbicola]